MIDRDKDPGANKRQDVMSQRQVTGHGIKIEEHEDIMKALFLDPEPRGACSLRHRGIRPLSTLTH
jgi:hypothetical protein